MPHPNFHAFIASQVSEDRSFIFGGIFPDCFELLKIKQKEALQFTKSLAKNKEFVQFYEGVKLHFFLDDYFHPNYVKPKSKELQNKLKPFKISYEVAHFFIEAALDQFVLEKYPYMKELLLEANEFYGTYSFSLYLGEYFNKDPKKIFKILCDCDEIVRLNGDYSFSNITKIANIFKNYLGKYMNSDIFTLIGASFALRQARKLVSKDWEEQINKALELVKK
jgi:hypothetical protein